ncbi:MAG: hypothetical protein LBN74_03880, partial [Prevotella sp.]|nr:hypothetical protein [Prevotella sp.]
SKQLIWIASSFLLAMTKTKLFDLGIITDIHLLFYTNASSRSRRVLKRFCFLLRLWAKGRQAICDCAR